LHDPLTRSKFPSGLDTVILTVAGGVGVGGYKKYNNNYVKWLIIRELLKPK
jgi:hypothetical protein